MISQRTTSFSCILSLPLFFVALLISPASGGQNLDANRMSSGGKLNPLQAIMDIRHYTLNLTVDIEKKSIKGSRANPGSKINSITA